MAYFRHTLIEGFDLIRGKTVLWEHEGIDLYEVEPSGHRIFLRSLSPDKAFTYAASRLRNIYTYEEIFCE